MRANTSSTVPNHRRGAGSPAPTHPVLHSLQARLLVISATATILLILTVTGLLTTLNDTKVRRFDDYLQRTFEVTCAELLHAQSVRLLAAARRIRQHIVNDDLDGALKHAAATGEEAVLVNALRLDLLDIDSGSTRNRGAHSGADPLIKLASVEQLLRRNGVSNGLLLGSSGIAPGSLLEISAAIPFDANRLLLARIDIEPTVQRIEALFRGKAIILDGDGRILLSHFGTATRELASRIGQSRRHQVVEHNGALVETIGSTLIDVTGRRVGSLHLLREDDGGLATDRLIGYTALIAAAISFVLFVAGLLIVLRAELTALVRITGLLDALSSQDLHAPAVDAGRSGEVGRIDLAVETLRKAAIERDRLSFSIATAHGRERAMIELEMRRFAEMLDRAERDEVLAKLEQVRSNGKPTEQPAELQADGSLASAFRFMSERVRAQQQRVSELLAERTADLETVRQALEERSDLFRLREELSVARNLQLSMLPDAGSLAPVGNRLTLEAITRPAKEVGGDSYDYQLLDGARKLLFLVCDASGKGVPAAMFVLTSRSLANAASEAFGRLDTGLTVANAALSRENDALSFTTMFLALLDLDSGILTYSNAGHNPPLLQRADGTIERLERATGLMLGAWEDSRYEEEHIELRAGDTLILYSDGITEAHNSRSELFGLERLEAVCAEARGSAPSDYIGNVLTAVDHHAGETPQFDDMTLLVLRYRPDLPADAQASP